LDKSYDKISATTVNKCSNNITDSNVQSLPIILIIEDEQYLNLIIRDAFEDENFKVYSAFSGEEGLLQLEKNSIDVCIVDIRLPGMTGNDFILAAHKLYPLLKFIIHTGSTDYLIPEQLKKTGIKKEHFFLKPVTDLTEIVNVAIEVYDNGLP